MRPRPLLKRLYSCIRRGFSTPKKSGDAKWYSLQTNLGSRRDYWRRSIHPRCATRRAPSLDRGSSAAGRCGKARHLRQRMANALPALASRRRTTAQSPQILGHPRSDRSVPHDSRRRLVQSRPRCHDKGTARDDRLMQWTTGIEQSPQGIVHRSDRHLGCLPAVAAREPSDVARCYELGFSADRALALQDDNDRVATRQYRAMSPVLG